MTTDLVAVSTAQSLELARPVTTAIGLKQLGHEIQALVNGLTIEVDYGPIPGTKGMALLKPGAEKLAVAFGAHPEFEVIEKEIDHDREVSYSKRIKTGWDNQTRRPLFREEKGASTGLYRYVVKCRLVRADGRVLAEGVGSCSTMESKYVDRPRDLENTVLKMAKKRANVDAVITAFALSNRFSQDMTEDGAIDDETDTTPPGRNVQQVKDAAKPTPAPAPEKPAGYDPHNRAHQDALMKQLEKMKVPEDKWDVVGAALTGKPFSEIAAAVAEVMSK